MGIHSLSTIVVEKQEREREEKKFRFLPARKCRVGARDGGKLPCGLMPLALGGSGVPRDPWIAVLFPKRFSPENGKTEETRPEKDQRPGRRKCIIEEIIFMSSNVCILTAALVFTERRPGEERQAQVDGRGIESVQRFVQLDGGILAFIEVAGRLDERVPEVLVGPKIAAFVGVGRSSTQSGRRKGGNVRYAVIHRIHQKGSS